MKDIKKMVNQLKVKRALKYALHALVLLLALKYVPQQQLCTQELLKIVVIVMVAFVITDLYAPHVITTQ